MANSGIAVLNSNFLGTEFNLLRDNIALAAVTYEFNILGIKGPRKMRAYLPRLNSRDDYHEFKMNNV